MYAKLQPLRRLYNRYITDLLTNIANYNSGNECFVTTGSLLVYFVQSSAIGDSIQ